jgi:hypothetical protein
LNSPDVAAIHHPDYAAIHHKVYRPGDDVEASGVYRVTHENAQEHEVTVLHGHKFPPCRHCGLHPRFVAVRLAQHIAANDHFHPQPVKHGAGA